MQEHLDVIYGAMARMTTESSHVRVRAEFAETAEYLKSRNNQYLCVLGVLCAKRLIMVERSNLQRKYSNPHYDKKTPHGVTTNKADVGEFVCSGPVRAFPQRVFCHNGNCWRKYWIFHAVWRIIKP